jgi:hypothetical protein
MSRFLGKLGFIHRRLWSEDGLYRAALLFGPAPLLGALLVGAVWAGVQALATARYQPPPWATPHPSAAVWSTAQPQNVQPALPLPPMGTDGSLAGYEAGWLATTNPIQVSPTMDVDVKTIHLTAFLLDGASVDVAQIIANGPQTSLYVGEARGFLAVKTAGEYALTLRAERPAGPVAYCLMRLVFGPRRIISNLRAGFANEAITYEAARFDLRPGLYPIAWVFGCWHDQEVIGPGRMTLLVGHPGEPMPLPALADDIVRPTRGGP